MSVLDTNMPVTLVVKAPNQKIADQTVECALGWTIRKLKEHLSSIYPSKPKEHQQKLIYSGKLLKDHLMLKDVLRQYDDSMTHTVHLVCSAGSDGSPSVQEPNSSNSHIPTSENTIPASSPSPNTDGLRHRDVQRESPAQSAPQAFYPNHFNGANPNPAAMPQYAQMPAFGPYAGAMHPQQLYWMQQMYAQQMTQYMQMQYMQQGVQVPQMPPVPHVVNEPAQPAAVAAPVNQPANNAPAANNRPANPNIVMNAQGGAMMDDDEEGNQDWLDWFYTICRIGVLMSIVYFYSSISRAILGFGFFLLMYLYQIGWFRLQRRNVDPRQQPAVAQEDGQQPAAEPAPTPPQPDTTEERPTSNDENDSANEDDSDSSASSEGQEQPQQPEVPQPNVLAVTWTFVKTFFTSLMPAQPQIVNAN